MRPSLSAALLVLLVLPAFGSDPRMPDAERERLEDLVRRGVPGAAWFRHRLHAAGVPTPSPSRFGRPDRPGEDRELDRTIGTISGGRAVAENLALDRALPPVGPVADEAVPLDSIEGISVEPFPHGEIPAADADPLARFVPADQHAVFCPSFAALDDLVAEADRTGSPLLRLTEDRGVDALTLERYESRLGFRLRGLRSIPVEQVAVTGSDLYLRTGSDVAILVKSRALAAAAPLLQNGFLLADDTLAVTISPAQAAKLKAVASGDAPALADSEDYRFFRARYRRGEEAETAFAVLPDAALRRWCGPRWRIAASRRTRAAALLAEARAAAVAGDEPPAGVDRVRQVYGTLDFLTPIADLDFATVTTAEAEAYRRWRRGYESTWAAFYDPIGARISITDAGIDADLTVFPLREDTDYDDLRELAGESTIREYGGDPHPGALIHLILAVDRRSAILRDIGEFTLPLTGGAKVNILDWIGDEFALWLDSGPAVDALAAAEDPEEWFREEGAHLPLVLWVRVRNPLGLAAFLAAVRGSLLLSAPGLVRFETRWHEGMPYVRVTPAREIAEDHGVPRICYATFGGALAISPDEDALLAALDRHRARREAEEAAAAADATPAPPETSPWLGKSLGLRISGASLPLLRATLGPSWRGRMRRQAFDDLPILNEWKRLFPDEDPVAVHRRIFGELLVSPGGGEYVFDEAAGTMESTVWGRPDAPKEGPALPAFLDGIPAAAAGLTFEATGLRARLSLQRTKPR